MNILRFAPTAALLGSTAFAQVYTDPSTGNVGVGTASPSYSLDVAGVLRNRSGADGYPYTKARIFVYGGDGIDTLNWGYFAYGDDANMRIVYGKESSNHSLLFGTSDNFNNTGSFTPKMTIDGGGNVGIGTSSPTAKLQIDGGSQIIRNNAAGNRLVWQRTDDTHITGFGSDGFSDLTLITNATEKVRVTSSGYVGIGTPYPQSRLDVSGRVTIMDGNRYWSLGAGRGIGSGNGYPDSAAMSDGSFAIRDVWVQQDRLRIDHLGNIGIGTTNPQHKLAVNGTIKAKEVIVETAGWSDYVFAKNYKLQSLSEIESHINANGHLPGIPSAADVSKQGVSIGDMQARLLAKIEELTLHQIAQEKKMAAMQAELNQLKSR